MCCTNELEMKKTKVTQQQVFLATNGCKTNNSKTKQQNDDEHFVSTLEGSYFDDLVANSSSQILLQWDLEEIIEQRTRR